VAGLQLISKAADYPTKENIGSTKVTHGAGAILFLIDKILGSQYLPLYFIA
jgi:hypothetical protein